MTVSALSVWSRAALVVASFSLPTQARAFDLTGLWASDSEACGKIFVTRGKKASLRKDSDLFGSGFIIDGDRITGRMARCTIKTKRESGSNIHILASCATDIMLGNVQLSVKVVDDNRITRIFPGIEGMEIDYVRCPAPPAAR
jgi:hypothetical protein